MAEILPFSRRSSFNIELIEKIVDGEVIRCVDVDALSPIQRVEFFSKGRLTETSSASQRPLSSR